MTTFKERMLPLMVLLGLTQWTSPRSLDHVAIDFRNVRGCATLSSASARLKVFLTISSIASVSKDGAVIDRQIELNWFGNNTYPGVSSVGLYDRDPIVGENSQHPLVAVNPADHRDGFFRTKISFPYHNFTLKDLSSSACLGYWIAYVVNGKVLASSCLRTYPRWMQDNKQELEKFRLEDIMIPGGHDAGSFHRYLGKASENIVDRYKYAQDEPIFNQLVYGLRYFDFRVGFYNETKEKFWINHSFFRTNHSVKSVLTDIAAFLKATEEIVILDFHEFPVGFQADGSHEDFMTLIAKKLRTYLIPSNLKKPLTMRELWAFNKRVLVAYNSGVITKSKFLWPEIARSWGNKRSPDDLKKYFMQIFSNPFPWRVWVSMAEMTPNARSIVRHPFKGLRILADEINRNVTMWFRDLWWKRANIVATDFLLGNNMVDVSIEVNKRKFGCWKKYNLSMR